MKLLSLLPALLLISVSAGADTSATASAANSLGLDLYRLEAAKSDGNVLLAPYSIQTALGMALTGADGQTRAELGRVLHFGKKVNDVPENCAALRQALEKAEAVSIKQAGEDLKKGVHHDSLQIRLASRLYGRRGDSFKADYLKVMRTQWQAPVETLDFAADADAARESINGWVEQRTEKRIQNLIPRGGMDAQTRLVLVNALYFKAAWAHEFSATGTGPLPFYAGGKTEVSIPTMHKGYHFGYTKGNGFSAVSLPYMGHAFQFLMILPDERNGLAAVEKQLSQEQLRSFAKLPRERIVRLYLPKFKLGPEPLRLAGHLKALGVKSTFDEPASSANFSRMFTKGSGDGALLSEVFHKTFLSLDEKGTEAAAATAVVWMSADDRPPRPVEVRMDHPFFFAIQHCGTGLCLFLGRVMDPRS